MKLIKSLLLGTAAGFAATAGAQAADLPSKKAAPVDYVRVCTIGSFTGFVIPGSDTCLKIGGFVRWQGTYNEPRWAFGAIGGGRGVNAFGQSATASLKIDARTTTEFGLLRSFADFRMNQGGTSGVDKAYIQFAGLHAGKVQSLFDFYADDASYGSAALGSDHSAVAIGYTASFGGGFYGVVSLEDPTTGNLRVGSTYGGTRWPDLVAAVGVEQSWGKAQLSGAIHHIWTPNAGFLIPGTTTVVNSAASDWGYAIQGGVKINVPSLGAGDALFLQAAYADGATVYLGSAPGVGSAIGNLGGFTSNYDFSYTASGSIRRTKGYSLLAAYEHSWSPTFFSNIFGGYTVFDPGKSATFTTFSSTGGTVTGVRKSEVYQIGANVTWKPVKGLLFAAEATYFNQKLNSPVTFTSGTNTISKKSDNVWQGVIRIQRDF